MSYNYDTYLNSTIAKDFLEDRSGEECENGEENGQASCNQEFNILIILIKSKTEFNLKLKSIFIFLINICNVTPNVVNTKIPDIFDDTCCAH